MKNRGRLIMRFVFFCGVIVSCLAGVGVPNAAAIDGPHNAINGMSCTTVCHTYSLWYQYSPAQQRPDFPAIVDTICFQCHKDGGTGSKAFTHSSAVIGSTTHGTWVKACTVCHNPHNQDQVQWAGTATPPYLVTGVISGVSVAYDSVSKETTITYANATTNSQWPAEGSSSGDLDWANKSLANPGRGLILVQDTVKHSNNYSIVAANATTVKVRGEITANMINPNYINPSSLVRNSATCNSFGLIYGDLIRNSIKIDGVTSRPVKFFDPNGGFVKAEGSTTTGICQVCHTQTAHYTSNGVMPSGADTHVGRNGTDCTTCHLHEKGFKGDGHDDLSFDWAGNCATCHNPGGAEVNITMDIHGGKCGLCHESSAGGGPRKAGGQANGVDGSALDGSNSSTCVDCHLDKLVLTGGAIHHESAHGYAAAGNCTQCHENAAGKLAAPHDSLVTEAPGCSSCHMVTAGLATGMPVSSADNMVHDACVACHNTNGSLKTASGTAIAVESGSCTTCHGSNGPHGEGFEGCNGCHGYPPVTSQLGAGGLVTSPSPTGGTSPGGHAKHATAAGYFYPCQTCHFGGMTVHGGINQSPRQLDVGFSIFGTTGGVYDGRTLLAPFSYTGHGATVTSNGAMTCSTIYCHSDGTSVSTGVVPSFVSPAWTAQGPLACNSCHGYPPAYEQDNSKSNEHLKHGHNTHPCSDCHYTTTSDGAHIADMTKHVNGKYDVVPDPTVGNAFVYTWAKSGGTCSNVSCHGLGHQDGAVWGDERCVYAIKITPGASCFERTFSLIEGQYNTCRLPGVSYLWDFGDGQTSTEAEPAHTYASAGTYVVSICRTLTVIQEAQRLLSWCSPGMRLRLLMRRFLFRDTLQR